MSFCGDFMKTKPIETKAKFVAKAGLMLAITLMLNALDSSFSAFLPFGVRLGLSNVAVLVTCVIINLPTAFVIILLKSVFIFATRGAFAAATSLGGGLFSFAVTALLLVLTNRSYVFISVASALTHSLAQIFVAILLTQSFFTIYYLPVLLATSVATGVFTGIIASSVIKRISHKKTAEG